MLTTALIAAIFVGLVGLLILWSNPARAINRGVCVSCAIITAWLACLHIATSTTTSDGLIWLRWSCTVGGLIPLSFWLVRESIVAHAGWFSWRNFGRQWGWLAATVVLCYVPFTDFFIPSHSSAV
jgi:hypothetical protein